VDTVKRPANMGDVRDLAVQRLRDLTIAVAIAAAAGVGVIAWVSAATIPGSAGTASAAGPASTSVDDQPASTSAGGFAQAPPMNVQSGRPLAVSGGSR
jgi:hypothetical protein